MRAAAFGSDSYAGTSPHYFCHVLVFQETAEGVLKHFLLFSSLPQIWGRADSVGWCIMDELVVVNCDAGPGSVVVNGTWM